MITWLLLPRFIANAEIGTSSKRIHETSKIIFRNVSVRVCFYRNHTSTAPSHNYIVNHETNMLCFARILDHPMSVIIVVCNLKVIIARAIETPTLA